jgi:hypothetical protein
LLDFFFNFGLSLRVTSVDELDTELDIFFKVLASVCGGWEFNGDGNDGVLASG